MKNQTRLAIASLSAALCAVGCSGGHDTSSTSSSAQGSKTVASEEVVNPVDSCGLHNLEYYRSAAHFRELSVQVKAYDSEHNGYDPSDACSRELHWRENQAAGMHTSFDPGRVSGGI